MPILVGARFLGLLFPVVQLSRQRLCASCVVFLLDVGIQSTGRVTEPTQCARILAPGNKKIIGYFLLVIKDLLIFHD